MNKRQKEILQAQLDNEKAVLKKLEGNYQDALDEINSKIELLMARQDADMQHVIYQVQYQQALKTQVQSILETLQTNEFETLSEYLTHSYEDGFVGTMYDLQGQGIPLIFPLDQAQIVDAIQNESKLSASLYAALGHDIKDLQKKIAGEISRGIAGGQMYTEIARNVSNWARIPKNNAMRIARTEAHRIQCKAAMDAQHRAKEKGADVVKQWDASLDKRTRDSHRDVDGEIRELDESFSNGLKYPGDPSGRPEEVINCRCALLQRARWALGNDYTKWSPDAEVVIDDDGTTQFANIEAKDYEEFQKKYKQASERVREDVQKMKAVNKNGEEIIFNLDGVPNEKQIEIKKAITLLSNEYDTCLIEVQYTGKSSIGREAGKVDVTGSLMQLNRGAGTTLDTVYHEFAHTFDMSKRSQARYGGTLETNQEYWKEAKKLFNKYKKEAMNNRSLKISEYSLTDVDEFMAEAFAASYGFEPADTFGVGSNSPYVKEAREIIDKYFKKTPLENTGKSSTIKMDLQFFAEKTKHGSERAIKRNIVDSQIDDAINNPLFKGDEVIDEQGRKSVKYIGNDATVVLNPDTGEVITTWKTGSRTRKKYGKGD